MPRRAFCLLLFKQFRKTQSCLMVELNDSKCTIASKIVCPLPPAQRCPPTVFQADPKTRYLSHDIVDYVMFINILRVIKSILFEYRHLFTDFQLKKTFSKSFFLLGSLREPHTLVSARPLNTRRHFQTLSRNKTRPSHGMAALRE